jgi:putative ATP-dependent DNA ligase
MDAADRAALAAALDAGDVADLAAQFQRREHDGVTFHALPDYRRDVEKGTAVVDGEVVRGFPSIPRTLVVDSGVPGYFDGSAAVEEKLNGYNVRVADLPAFDGPVAFTRSGYVCPYTTARARDLLDLEAFFADHPDRMLCGELVGPENPYTSHDYAEVDSHDMFVFGVRERRGGEPLPVDRRRAVCREYGFRQPERFDVAAGDELAAVVADAVADLDGRGREGVVLTGVDGAPQLKYTTGTIHRQDLAHAFSLPYDYGRDFLFSRVVREGFQSAEFDDEAGRRERAHALGEAILLPLVEAIETVQVGEPLGEDHTVRGAPEVVAALLDHLEDQGLRIDVHGDRREDSERVVDFRKVAASSTDSIRAHLEGRTVDE